MNFEIKSRAAVAVLYSTQISDSLARMDPDAQLGFVIKKAVSESVGLQDAYLHGANLHGADLQGAKLQGVDLRCAYLQGANLRGAKLQGANLRTADLRYADLRGADLRGADLRYANLQDADLLDANLQDAHLQDANLRGAYLQGADLRGANLQDAHLLGANLQTVKNLEKVKDFRLTVAQTRILPAEGPIVGWKKCNDNVIVKLLVPAEAKRSHAFGRKCRAEYVDVLAVFGDVEGVTSYHGPKTTYRVGERVKPTSFDPDWLNECAPGIHFFITREEAEAYY